MGIKKKALEQLLHMGIAQFSDLLEGLEQQLETMVQLAQLIAQVAIDEVEACSQGRPTRKGETIPERRGKGKGSK